MALAHAALNIVIDRHAGGLQSYETDAITRLMAADRIVHLMYAGVERIWEERTHDDHTTVCHESIDPLFSRTAVKLLALAPDYIPVDYRGSVAIGPGYHYHHNKALNQFEYAILDRKRACIWERFRRAEALCAAYTTDISDRFPVGHEPTLTAMQFSLRQPLAEGGWVEIAPPAPRLDFELTTPRSRAMRPATCHNSGR